MRQFALPSGGKCQTSSWSTTRKTFYDTPRLLHIEQQKKDNFCQYWFSQERFYFGGCWSHTAHNSSGEEAELGDGGVRRGCLGVNSSVRRLDVEGRICSESTPLRASSELWSKCSCEREKRRRMCCTSDLGDSEGARRRKTSSLHFHACIYYSPKSRQWGQWRNERASSSTGKVIGRRPGANVSFIILTPDPWPQTFRGHSFHFKQFVSLRRARPVHLCKLQPLVALSHFSVQVAWWCAAMANDRKCLSAVT